jgi:hypothetical protein
VLLSAIVSGADVGAAVVLVFPLFLHFDKGSVSDHIIVFLENLGTAGTREHTPPLARKITHLHTHP